VKGAAARRKCEVFEKSFDKISGIISGHAEIVPQSTVRQHYLIKAWPGTFAVLNESNNLFEYIPSHILVTYFRALIDIRIGNFAWP